MSCRETGCEFESRALRLIKIQARKMLNSNTLRALVVSRDRICPGFVPVTCAVIFALIDLPGNQVSVAGHGPPQDFYGVDGQVNRQHQGTEPQQPAAEFPTLFPVHVVSFSFDENRGRLD